MERDEVISVVIAHFRGMGIYQVKPLAHAKLVRANIIYQLRYNPQIKQRLIQIAKEIEKLKTKHSRHNE